MFFHVSNDVVVSLTNLIVLCVHRQFQPVNLRAFNVEKILTRLGSYNCVFTSEQAHSCTCEYKGIIERCPRQIFITN